MTAYQMKGLMEFTLLIPRHLCTEHIDFIFKNSDLLSNGMCLAGILIYFQLFPIHYERLFVGTLYSFFVGKTETAYVLKLVVYSFFLPTP